MDAIAAHQKGKNGGKYEDSTDGDLEDDMGGKIDQDPML